MEIEQWSLEYSHCISPSKESQNLAPNILTTIQNGNQSYWAFFFNKSSQVITSKQFNATSRFNALYLLFNATEKGDIDFGMNLLESPELVNFLFRTAQHEATGRIALDERGKQFFSIFPTRTELRIGINFVRLSLEVFIKWHKLFGREDAPNDYNLYYNTLKNRIKLPTYFYFIDKDYDFSQNLAAWNYGDSLPRKANQNTQEEVERASLTKNNEISNDLAFRNSAGTKSIRRLNTNAAVLKIDEDEQIRNNIFGEIRERISQFRNGQIRPESKKLSLMKTGTQLKLIAQRLKKSKTEEPTSPQSAATPSTVRQEREDVNNEYYLCSTFRPQSKKYQAKMADNMAEIKSFIEKSKSLKSFETTPKNIHKSALVASRKSSQVRSPKNQGSPKNILIEWDDPSSNESPALDTIREEGKSPVSAKLRTIQSLARGTTANLTPKKIVKFGLFPTELEK